MSGSPPSEVARALDHGSFCHVAATTRFGPHVTPMVFVSSGDRLWVTTSRRSVKARAWRDRPDVGGLVRAGDAAVIFTGVVRTYDLLDPGSWVRGAIRGPVLAEAAARFTAKNARFFAGYAVDAHRVPLSWTPPGRVFVEIDMERGALLLDGEVAGTWGGWTPSLVSRRSFRADRRGPDPVAWLPRPVSEALGRRGIGALAFGTPQAPVVLPAGWVLDGTAVYASVGTSALELAALAEPTALVALATDKPSWWRANRMVGAMVQGRGEVSVPDRLGSGARSAVGKLALIGATRAPSALVRIRPERLVWWQGWESGNWRVA